jgi:hypothetical protein
MRILLLLLFIVAIRSCAGAAPEADPALPALDPAAPVVEAQMPLRLLRDEGQNPRMGAPELFAGSYAEDAPFSISFAFHSEGLTLGPPQGVGMSVRFGDYCRDRPGWLQAVLIAPSGESWRGHRVRVPAGPDRNQDWSSGYVDAPEVRDAVAAGGLFTLALQDDEGRLWHEVRIDVLTPERRARLYEENLVAFRSAGATTTPVASDLLTVVYREPKRLPSPPRPCPAPAP